MAARRLLLVMIVLLVLSSLAAALVSPPPEESGTTTDTTTAEKPGEEQRPAGPGRLVRESVSVQGPARQIELTEGDQLALRVTSRRFVQVAIPQLGLLDTASPGSPARFSLLAPEPVSYAVRLLNSRKTVAQITVRDQQR